MTDGSTIGNLSSNVEVPSPYVRRFLVVRILWMTGLTINPEEYPDGTSTLLGLLCVLIILL